MGLLDKLRRLGRRARAPERETRPWPSYIPLGQLPSQLNRAIFKPTPRNLRMFGKFPYARRALNTIKNPISQLAWEVRPVKGVDLNSELKRQIVVATEVLQRPNDEIGYHDFLEQVLEDMLFGAGSFETQPAGDPVRPLWMWPVDGLSVQIYPNWSGERDKPRYLQTMGYGGYSQVLAPIPLRDDELVYIKPNPSTATPFGLGPMEVAFDAIARLLGAQRYAGQVASNAGPPYLLDLGGVGMEELLAFRKYWRDEIEGRGETPIVGSSPGDKNDKKAIPLKPTDDASLYPKWQEILIRCIATSFDISPQNLAIEADVNRNTSEVAEDRDWDHAIKPWARRYTRTISKHVIQDPRRLGFTQLELVLKGMDREDEMATAEIFEIRYRTNSITPNEMREHYGEPPMDGPWGDKTAADVEIAKLAARGVGQVLDPELPQGGAKPKLAKRQRRGAAKD